jgi:hypothetical protein
MLYDDSALPTRAPTYYNSPVDNIANFAFTIATTPALCGLACIDIFTRSWSHAITHREKAESGCKFIANESVVDPRGADNLTQDARTIDLTPVFACMHTQLDSVPTV